MKTLTVFGGISALQGFDNRICYVVQPRCAYYFMRSADCNALATARNANRDVSCP